MRCRHPLATLNPMFAPALKYLWKQIRDQTRDIIPLPVPEEEAPDTFEKLQSAVYRDSAGLLVIPVSESHGETSIWGPNGNKVFRAWHDNNHLETGIGFGVQDERRLAEYEQGKVRPVPYTTVHVDARRILYYETRGQVDHYEKYGAFPVDQAAFVICCFQNGMAATLEEGQF